MSSEAPWAPYEDAFRYRVDEGQNLAGPTITDEITRAVEVKGQDGCEEPVLGGEWSDHLGEPFQDDVQRQDRLSDFPLRRRRTAKPSLSRWSTGVA